MIKWLESLELSEYSGLFEKEAITWDALVALKMNDLEDMGITKLGHKKKLMKSINQLASKHKKKKEKTLSEGTYSPPPCTYLSFIYH